MGTSDIILIFFTGISCVFGLFIGVWAVRTAKKHARNRPLSFDEDVICSRFDYFQDVIQIKKNTEADVVLTENSLTKHFDDIFDQNCQPSFI